MRSLTGKLNWAAREGMPNGSGDASLQAGTLPQPNVMYIQEASDALRRLMQAQATITIRLVQIDRIRLLMFSDRGIGSKTGHSNIGRMICAADKSVLDGKEADVSILCRQSHNAQRAGSITLLRGANAMSEGLADAGWAAT